MSSTDINITIEDAQPINITIDSCSFVDYANLKDYIIIEEPTKVNSKRFQTASPFESTNLKVFLNGIKEKYVTVISDTEFEFEDDTVTDDIVEVEYLKKVS